MFVSEETRASFVYAITEHFAAILHSEWSRNNFFYAFARMMSGVLMLHIYTYFFLLSSLNLSQ